MIILMASKIIIVITIFMTRIVIVAITSFLLPTKLKKIWFSQKTFLLANIRIIL